MSTILKNAEKLSSKIKVRFLTHPQDIGSKEMLNEVLVQVTYSSGRRAVNKKVRIEVNQENVSFEGTNTRSTNEDGIASFNNLIFTKTGRYKLKAVCGGDYAYSEPFHVFERKVLLHVVSNSLHKNMAPCFLAIEGRMGEGKTVQTINTCFKHGIHVYYFSSSQLAENLERDSIRELEPTYNYLAEHNGDDIFNVIIIDDFHLSVASCGINVSRTVNSQLLTDYLMSIADMTKASPGKKIPVILIANTFENLYSPLTRDGRMNLFKWEPSKEQKQELICKMFKDILKNGITGEFIKFVREYSDEPISFFGEVKNDIYINIVEECLKDENFSDLCELVGKLNEDMRIYDKKFIEVHEICQYASRRKNGQVKKKEKSGASNLGNEEAS